MIEQYHTKTVWAEQWHGEDNPQLTYGQVYMIVNGTPTWIEKVYFTNQDGTTIELHTCDYLIYNSDKKLVHVMKRVDFELFYGKAQYLPSQTGTITITASGGNYGRLMPGWSLYSTPYASTGVAHVEGNDSYNRTIGQQLDNNYYSVDPFEEDGEPFYGIYDDKGTNE